MLDAVCTRNLWTAEQARSAITSPAAADRISSKRPRSVESVPMPAGDSVVVMAICISATQWMASTCGMVDWDNGGCRSMNGMTWVWPGSRRSACRLDPVDIVEQVRPMGSVRSAPVRPSCYWDVRAALTLRPVRRARNKQPRAAATRSQAAVSNSLTPHQRTGLHVEGWIAVLICGRLD